MMRRARHLIHQSSFRARHFPRDMLYRFPGAADAPRVCRLNKLKVLALALLTLLPTGSRAQEGAQAQTFEKSLDVAAPVELRVKNPTGRVTVVAEDGLSKVSVRATSAAGLAIGERDVRVTS